MTLFLSREGVKIGVTKSKVFKEFVVTLLASTRVFHKKKLIFVIFDVLFVDVELVLDNCRPRGLPLQE